MPLGACSRSPPTCRCQLLLPRLVSSRDPAEDQHWYLRQDGRSGAVQDTLQLDSKKPPRYSRGVRVGPPAGWLFIPEWVALFTGIRTETPSSVADTPIAGGATSFPSRPASVGSTLPMVVRSQTDVHGPPSPLHAVSPRCGCDRSPESGPAPGAPPRLEGPACGTSSQTQSGSATRTPYAPNAGTASCFTAYRKPPEGFA